MKMNIKGLVFVGFAAAVFASAANAALPAEADQPKTVTSVKFTEATYVKKNADIIGSTKTKITYDAKGLVTAGADLEASDIPDISNTYQLKSERVEDLNNPNNSTYPTTQAVADALVEAGAKVGNGTISVTQNGVGAGSFTTNQDTAGSVTIAAPDWNATAGTAGEILNKPAINDGTLTITQGSTTSTFSANTANDITIDIPESPDIPTPAANTCTAAAPCALVWAGGTTPTWEPIQQ